jgi:hypothetical protein
VVLQAGAIAADGSVKGGPYTAGPLPGSIQYGILDVTDNGGSTIQCRFSGKRASEGTKLTFAFTASAAAIDTGIPSTGSTADRALVNISSRGRISNAGDTQIVGFVVGGKTPRSILLRAVGPSLAAFGLTDVVTHPAISLFQQNGTVVASNDDWGLVDATRLTAAFDRAGAFRFLNATSHDAALFLSLNPGAYTLQAWDTNGATGNIVVEVYEVP